MVKSFYTSSLLLDVLSVFGELSEEVSESRPEQSITDNVNQLLLLLSNTGLLLSLAPSDGGLISTVANFLVRTLVMGCPKSRYKSLNDVIVSFA